MKRLSLFFLLAAVPTLVLGQTTHYIVTTAHPWREAVQRLPREDFDPAVRTAVRAHPFEYVLNGFDAELTADQVKRLLASGEVEDIEPVVERHVMDDTITPGQQTTGWGVTDVKAPDVWPVTNGLATNGSGPIHVAIIDTGIDYNQSELKNAYKGGHNFITGTDDPLDDFGHGTHVAGIIAAADDGQGMVGVAPGVDLYSLKVLDQCGSGSSANVIHALDWIVAKKTAIGGNWVVNLSLGSDTPSTAEQASVQNAENAGVIIVAAAGNGYDDTTSIFFQTDGLAYPGGYPGVLSVGAIDDTNLVAPFSQRGTSLQVVAPGVAVLSTIVGAGLATDDGRKYSVMLAGAIKPDGITADPNVCFDTPKFSGSLVDCKRGQPTDFPASAKGKIALIERGDITFLSKVTNAIAAGAAAVVFYDNRPPDPTFGGPGFTETSTGKLPPLLPLVMLTQADGQALLATPNAVVTVNFGLESYGLESGTSMATPHATGVVALAWAAAPNATSIEVQKAIVDNATDLGDAGVDNVYGHGLVNALNAVKQLAPPPPTGRTPGRRGH